MAEQPDTQADLGKGEDGKVRRWLLELELADKQEKDWRDDSRRILKRYRGEDCRTTEHDGGGSKLNRNVFNILWSNTETLRPALYNSTPQPNVKRRFRDRDPVGKAVADVLERALDYAVDAYDFDERMILALNDYLLPGRGVTRVRYIPSFNQTEDENGETSEELAYEDVSCEHVNWEDFRRGPGRTWREVPWVAFKHKLTRDELTDKFGDLGEKVTLDCKADLPGSEKKESKGDETVFNRGEVWEIWDKESREVVFISRSVKAKPLLVEDDPLNLSDFFPIPRPLYSMESSNSLVPIPEYQLYETLAVELDRVTSRIIRILDGLRLRGVYDSTMSELDKLFEKGDNKMIPAENLAKIIQQGGIEKSIWMLPVDQYAQVLQYLYQYRQSLIQSIYEITGISDIFRGQSKASETAEAQRIKSNWGTLRLQRRQREVQRYARDLIRIKAEIIAENFQPETLALMTGLDFPSAEEKQRAQITVQTAQTYGQQAPQQVQQIVAQAQEVLEKPSWDEIKQIMSNDMLRQFKVDIETDSTVAEQMADEKEAVVELMTGVVEFVNGVGPAVQSGYIPMDTAKAMLMAAVRRFKLGTEVEDSLEEIGKQQGQQGPTAEERKEQMELQEKQLDLQRSQAQHQADMEKLRMEMQAEREKHQMEMARIRAESQAAVTEQAAQARGDMVEAAQ